MFPPRHRLGAAVVLLLAATLATGCAAAAPPAAQPTESSAPTPTTAPPEATPTPEPAAAEPTCETLIGEDIVADFESIGWTSQAQPFYLGEAELDGGIDCRWADFGGPAGDHLQIFAWAPIAADAAADAQSDLVSQGWLREESPEGVYITEAKETTIAVDSEGYGMTYLFGDGWVKLADTKQGLLLIEWPAS
ncbi:hypothetical protein ASD56_11230 [Microbacterium sp. Root166]|uniref:hypothetical protein n=1 Tax=Microbacterium sp. Root166 TaxID=1736478 RepID=UPI0006F80147|nr:hypothetical protein [Microbacterium sp. Root166]KQZ84513.1 hypothetical protein ASD56_11230 [Microbacterium sp. Root166]